MPGVTKPPVTIDFRLLNIPPATRKLGVEQDSNSERVEFIIPRVYLGFDLADKTIVVDTLNDENQIFHTSEPTKVVIDDNIYLSWIVGPIPASVRGKAKLRLRAIGPDFVWLTETGEFDLMPTFKGVSP